MEDLDVSFCDVLQFLALLVALYGMLHITRKIRDVVKRQFAKKEIPLAPPCMQKSKYQIDGFSMLELENDDICAELEVL